MRPETRATTVIPCLQTKSVLGVFIRLDLHNAFVKASPSVVSHVSRAPRCGLCGLGTAVVIQISECPHECLADPIHASIRQGEAKFISVLMRWNAHVLSLSYRRIVRFLSTAVLLPRRYVVLESRVSPAFLRVAPEPSYRRQAGRLGSSLSRHY